MSEVRIPVKGEIIAIPIGIRNDLVVVQEYPVRYENGDLGLTYRYASNPHGVSWRGFVRAESVPEIRYIGKTNEHLDPRSLMP